MGESRISSKVEKDTGLQVVDDYNAVIPHRKTVTEMVKQFHRLGRLPIATEVWNDTYTSRRRINLITEEYEELMQAFARGDAVEALDALCDLVYVCVGTAVEYGWNFDEAFDRVHKSNLTKVKTPRYREDGKFLKSDDFEPPDLKDLIK